MATKHTKYGKAYDTPHGLQEDNYYEMMYDLMDYVNKKGLTTRQAQSLFTDCADMILDIQINSISATDIQNNETDMQRIINELRYIGERLEYLPTRLYVNNL